MRRTSIPVLIASGMGSGLCPRLPGTVGSATLLLLWALPGLLGAPMTPFSTAIAAAGCLCIGWLATRACLAESPGATDPQYIVIDEWTGMLIALIPARPLDLASPLLAFVLFRLFDILKPGPVGAAERAPGALGVMLDDVVAGILAGLVLQALLWWFI